MVLWFDGIIGVGSGWCMVGSEYRPTSWRGTLIDLNGEWEHRFKLHAVFPVKAGIYFNERYALLTPPGFGSVVPEFNRRVVPEFNRRVVPEFNRRVVPEHRRNVVIELVEMLTQRRLRILRDDG